MDEKIGFEAVYDTFDQGKVAFIKSLFDAHSINYYVDNENVASVGFGMTTGIMTFMVAKNQVDLARELLQEIKD